MKLRSFSPLGAILAAVLTASVLSAQTPTATDSTTKDTPQENRSWPNCLFILEVYALDKNDAFTVLDTERGNAGRYQRVVALSKAGKARLETLTALATKDRQRALSEALDEVPYPVEFALPLAKGRPPVPEAWAVQNVGTTVEFEPTLSPDGRTGEVNLVPQRVSFAGFREYGEPGGAAPATSPVFQTQKITASVVVTPGEPQYLGTFTPPTGASLANGEAASSVWLAFVHLNLQNPRPEELPPPAKTAPGTGVQLEYTCYSLERSAAREVLLASASIAAPWQKMQALLGEKKARLEHLSSLQTKTGRRAVVEEIEGVAMVDHYEARAPSENPPEPEPAPGAPTRFSTRNTGVTIEVEPFVAADGLTVDLSNVVQNVTDFGPLKATGVAANYLPQPVFSTRKITTRVKVLAGQRQLIGTFNPPHADGVNDRTDSGRTWLLFVRASPTEP